MIIDAHVHISDDGKWFNTNIDASVDRLEKDLEKSAVDKVVILPLNEVTSNESVRDLCRKYPDRFIGLATVDPVKDKKAVNNLEKAIQDYRLKGLKLHPRRQGFAPNNSLIYPVLEKAIDLEIPVLFDTYLQNNNVALNKLLPFEYDLLAKRYPELKIILAHAGGHRVLDAYFVAKANENVYLDVSHVFTYFQGSSVISDLLFVIRHLDRKIIYGSDFPESSLSDYYNLVNKNISQLSDCDTEAIYGGTVAKLLRL
jgi:predicted TIM-barrel fold metal-dependent hydrolase